MNKTMLRWWALFFGIVFATAGIKAFGLANLPSPLTIHDCNDLSFMYPRMELANLIKALLERRKELEGNIINLPGHSRNQLTGALKNFRDHFITIAFWERLRTELMFFPNSQIFDEIKGTVARGKMDATDFSKLQFAVGTFRWKKIEQCEHDKRKIIEIAPCMMNNMQNIHAEDIRLWESWLEAIEFEIAQKFFLAEPLIKELVERHGQDHKTLWGIVATMSRFNLDGIVFSERANLGTVDVLSRLDKVLRTSVQKMDEIVGDGTEASVRQVWKVLAYKTNCERVCFNEGIDAALSKCEHASRDWTGFDSSLEYMIDNFDGQQVLGMFSLYERNRAIQDYIFGPNYTPQL